MSRPLFALSLGTLLLLAGAAGAQDTATGRTRDEAATTDDVADLSDTDLPAARQLVEDEAQHRDRLARIRRLRTLAEESGDLERLARLDDLEHRQNDLHEARRLRARAALSERGRATADDFVRRGGTWHARVENHQAKRERAAVHQARRERAAQSDQSSGRSRSGSTPPRGVSRSSRPSGGRSPR